MASFFREENDGRVIFTGDGELIYYIPKKYFDITAAIIIGEVVKTMGIFTYGLFDSKGKMLSLKRFNLPTMFECKPSLITKETDYLLKDTKTIQDYRLLHFKKGDELICNVNVPKSLDNVDKFMDMFIMANLPENIPYNEIHEYIAKNASINGFNYNVSPQMFGILISELCRDPKDLSKPFRLSGMKDMLDYKAISIKKCPKYTSPYTAITSENADEAIAAAITTKGTGNSPLEKVMMV